MLITNKKGFDYLEYNIEVWVKVADGLEISETAYRANS